MRKSLCLAVALALVASPITLAAPSAKAEELASPMIPPKAPPPNMPQDVVAAWGCVTLGSLGTTAAMLANSENLLNVVAGGVVAPANPSVLYLGLAGVVFTSFCSLGQQLTPLYLYYFQREPVPEVEVAKSSARRVAGAERSQFLDDDDVLYPWESARGWRR